MVEPENEAAPVFTRQMGIVAPSDLDLPVTVIGLGGIGSFTVDVLAKMGCTSIRGFDPDMVEPHNIPNQRYGPRDAGKPKSKALFEFVRRSIGTRTTMLQERWEGKEANQRLYGIVIAAVDSIEMRKGIWRCVKRNPAVRLFIDGRIGGEYSIVYSLVPTDPEAVRKYDCTLFSSREAVELPCTERAVIYVGYGTAARIATVVRLYTRGQDFPFVIRDNYSHVTVTVD